MTTYSYEIDKRPDALGGGYRLRLFEDGQEVGGGVFVPDNDTEPAELDAHMQAEDEAQYWLSTRDRADNTLPEHGSFDGDRDTCEVCGERFWLEQGQAGNTRIVCPLCRAEDN